MGIYLKQKGRIRNQIINNMPGFDGKGPVGGYGPGTGRGLGPCGYGRGYGRRYEGYGRGYGRRFFTRDEEKDILQEEVEELKKELEAAKEKLSEIEGKK